MKQIAFGIIAAFVFLNADAQTSRITFQSPLLYPEGVAFNNKTNMFFISSVTTGTIGTADRHGNYKVFYNDQSLKSTFGMRIDTKRNRLWICAGDPNYSKFSDSSTYKKKIRLIGIDLSAGKKTEDIDLSNVYTGKHFANDLTLDDSGNIYITDSYSPVIYKVDATGKASVFATSELFKGEDVGLNGIVFSPKGYLLTTNTSNGSLLKIDIGNPGKISKVQLKNFYPGADGLLWNEQNNLVLIQNRGVNKAFQLTSNDNWNTAEAKAATAATDRFQHPSSGTIANGKIFLVNSKINELSDHTLPPSKEFSLQLIEFKPVK